MQFGFSTIENVKKAELIQVFNSAFEDYFIKIGLNEKSLADKMSAENIVQAKSVGAFLNDKLVGFILIGIENNTAYNGGTGVLSEYRGNALTKQMYDFILPELKAENVNFHRLEVIAKNVSAIKTYEKIGFQTARNLACFKGKIKISKINNEVELKVLDEFDEQLLSSFQNAPPTWQNSFSAINRTKNLHKIIGAFYANKLVGFLIYAKSGRIKQFAVKQDFRHKGIGQTLFAQLDSQEIVITNTDKNDRESVSFLRKLGLDLFLEQFEMTLTA